ncbi:CS1-pili formation C-terminal domain-containing protein, partial [Pseudomonadales bacterium]|nr:CS1-pili formation C-terminal domain-containing protein [Pseudomonadales bacterium]
SLNGSLEFSTNDGDNQLFFRLNYRFQKNRWVHVAAARYQDRGQQGNVNNDGGSGYMSSDWRNASSAANQYQVGLRADSEDSGTFETRVAAKGNLGKAALTSEYRHDLGYANYSGSANTSFVVTEQAFGIGGDRQALSGFLVSTKGKSDQDGDISVIVDGSKRAKIKLNSTRFVPASEYDTHDIAFLTEGKTLLNVDTKTYRKTLYPGNVIGLEIEAKRILVALGQLLKPDGTPLSHGLLLGTQGIATTDDQGYFQAEIDADMTSITVKKAGQECVVNLDSPSTNTQVVHLGTRTCQ